jgi:hypothetical protein
MSAIISAPIGVRDAGFITLHSVVQISISINQSDVYNDTMDIRPLWLAQSCAPPNSTEN